jgi:hypothetical protein
MLICLSGPMSGQPSFNNNEFAYYEKRRQELGHKVLSPHRVPKGLTEREYMKLSIEQVFTAESICVLPGYYNPKGAMAEVALAIKLELPIYHFNIQGKTTEQALIAFEYNDSGCSAYA